MHGDGATKCQPGCRYPKTDTIISQGNFTGSNASVVPRPAEKCFLQPTGLALQATSNQFFNPHTSLYAIWIPINQDLNMTESLKLNCKQPSKITNSATEFGLTEQADDPNPVQDDIHDFLPEHATASRKSQDKLNQQKLFQSVTQHRNPKHQLLLWRITRRQHYLNHTNPLLVLKSHNFTRESRLRGSILQKRSPSTCQPLHNLCPRLLNLKSSTINYSTQSYQKNQAAEPPPTTDNYLPLANPNSILPKPSPVVPPDNANPSNTHVRSSSKDTVQP
ncbi:unnamed protein product, partial [Hymenolepis diminuta]